MTATAQTDGGAYASGGGVQASSRASAANALDAPTVIVPGGTPTPLSTLRALSSVTPTLTPTSLTPTTAGTTTPTAATTTTVTSSPAVASTDTTPTPAAAVLAASQASPASGDFVAQVLKLLNDDRATQGRAPLTYNPTLAGEATAYAKLMADRNFFGHEGLDGSTSESRVRTAAYRGSFRGEALAAGQTTPQGVVNTWLTSPAHAAIVLDASAVDVGIGYAYGSISRYGHYWVLVTGVP